jgi:hypothetical protein
MAQGIAKPATQQEIDKEATYTDPNLHRRIVQDSNDSTEYTLLVHGRNSYRIVKTPVEDIPDEYEIP